MLGGRGGGAVTKKDVRKELNFLKEGMRKVCNLFSAFRGSSAEQNEKRNESREKNCLRFEVGEEDKSN